MAVRPERPTGPLPLIGAALLLSPFVVLTSAASVQAATQDAARSAYSTAVLDLRDRAPCQVSGYSGHARQRMTERGISADEVERVVLAECSSARKQRNGNWRYAGRRITVIAAAGGYVVTVWRDR